MKNVNCNSKVLNSDIILYHPAALFVSRLQDLALKIILDKISQHNVIDFKKLEDERYARIWGDVVFFNWVFKLTNDEKNAIYYYTSASSKLNHYLRNYEKIQQKLNEKPITEKLK